MKTTVRFLIAIVLAFGPPNAGAERLAMQFNNNKVKVLVSRSSSDGVGTIKIEIYAPEKRGYSIFNANNPSRIVIDFKNARVTRSKALEVKNSATLKSIRLGVHPEKLRAVLELRGNTFPKYTFSEQGDWFTIILPDKESTSPTEEAEGEEDAEVTDEELDFNGEIWNKVAHDLKNDNSAEGQLYEHLEIKPEFKLTYDRSLYAVAGAEADLFYWEHDEEAEGEVRPYNIYVNQSGKNYNLRVGNQIVAWGKSDEVSPLDNLNPEDLRDGIVRRRAERKLPVPMANLEYRQDVSTLQAIYIPTFKRSRISFFDDDWALAPGSATAQINEDRPEGAFEAGEFGFRYSDKISSFDYALSYLSTISDTPSVDSVRFPFPPSASGPVPHNISQLLDLAAASGAEVDIEYNRREIWGAEFETVFGDLGLRGDFAYTNDEDYFTSNLTAAKSATYRYVIGLDYTSPSDLYINLQFGQTYIDNYSDAYLFNDHVANSIFEEIWQEVWDNNLKLGVRGYYDFSRNGHFFNPYALLTYWENYQFELGLDVVGGDSDSLIGIYRDNDQGYLLAKAYF